ncbi:MAG: transporter substrate-binding protein [Microbacteriaceae bacterium]|nr:transporter substrate-binding protein [Microbacteriaceae bacterium]
MRLPIKAGLLLTTVAVAAIAITGCSSSSQAPAAGGKISLVASTDVWGDVAKQIGGNAISVTSIITDPNQDPHSYEADAQVQLALSHASVVIENGGGYDDFVDTLLKGANNPKATVLNAVDISGFAQNSNLNEHVWYDFPTVQKVAAKITAKLSSLDSANAAVFAANQKKFEAALGTLEASEAAIKASPAGGSGVAITEPVPLYLLEASGLVNKTPAKFSEAIENGTDVAPDLLQQTLALFSGHKVKLLSYNEQTTGPQTEQVLAAAKAAGVAVVPVRETLPAGKDYLAWMTDNIAAVKAALQ